MKKITAGFLAILWLPIPSFAWGPEGHRVIADLARERLNRAAVERIRELLGNDGLGAISTWADEIRSERPETSGWHFVDIPWNASGFSESRDCYRPEEKHPASFEDRHNCVVDRIEISRQVLANKNATRPERVEALKFLVHFVGDLHQPLHAIGEARGGNETHVVEFGKADCGGRPCNLHYAWDITLIEHSGRSENNYVSYLDGLIAQSNLRRDAASGSAEDWANESFRLAKHIWVNDGGAVDEAYYRKNIQVIDQQLALAGLRLAIMLNQTLGR